MYLRFSDIERPIDQGIIAIENIVVYTSQEERAQHSTQDHMRKHYGQ